MLKTFNIRDGDFIAICCENRIEFLITLLASIQLGAVVVPINPNFCDRKFFSITVQFFELIVINFFFNLKGEINHIIEITRPKIIFTSTIGVTKITQTLIDLPYLQSRICLYTDDSTANVYEHLCYDDLMKSFREQNYETNEISINGNTLKNIKNQTAIILFSSGTTGMAKGVELTHFNLLATLTKLK